MGIWRDYWCFFLLCLLISFLTCKTEGPDETVCQYYANSGDSTFPAITDKMEVRVQILHKYIDNERITNLNENIDLVNKQISIRVSELNYEERYYFFGLTSEIVRLSVVMPGTADEQPQVCNVSNFIWDNKTFIAETLDSTWPHYLYSYTILYAAKEVANKSGTAVIDGIIAEKWIACLYFSQSDITIQAEYYFTASSVETPYNKNQSIPLKIELSGSRKHTDKFTATIKYMDVRYDYVQKWQFQLPAGTYCEGRKLPEGTAAFKKDPKYFKTDVEVVIDMIGFTAVNYVKWWNDKDNKIGRLDIRPTKALDLPLGRNKYLPKQTNIIDENRDIRFVITHKSCKKLKIKEISQDDDTLNSIFTYYQEFYDAIANTSKPYKYQDQRMDRGILCNVFATEDRYVSFNEATTDLEVIDDIEELLTSADPVVINTGRTAENGVPVRYSIYDKKKQSRLSYQFFDFDDEVEAVYSFDTSACVDQKEIKHFKFYLTDENIDKIKLDSRETGYGVHRSLATAAGISPLRISNVKIEFKTLPGGSKIYPHVRFTLLGPSAASNDPSLSDAETSLKANLKGTINITVPDPEDFSKSFSVKYFEAQGITEFKLHDEATVGATTAGYSPGDMAGLAIGMIIMGCLLALCLIYVFSMYDIAGFNDGLGAHLFHK